MQIKELKIIEYASLKNRSFNFESGLNIIEGENESGKSTLLSFIKFMLYGFPKGKSIGAAEEREKSYSWENGIAAGSMTVSTAEGDFRIERSAREGVKGDKLSIINLADGAPVYKGEIPGELFLGVPLALFESTACVKQLGCTNLDGGEIGSAIQNLLLAADENVDTSRALGRIDALRKKLLLKKGMGGTIYYLGLKKDELSARLKTAKERSVQIMEYETAYEKASKNYAESRTKVEEYSVLNRAYEANQSLIKLDFVRSTKSRIDKIEGEIAALKAEECHDGFVPGSEYQRELALANNDYENALKEHAEKFEAASEARRRVPQKSERDSLAEKVEKNGGAAGLASRFGAAKRKAKKMRSMGIFSLILTIVFGMAAAFAMCRSVLKIAFLPQITFDLLEDPLLAYLFAALTAVFLIMTAVFFANSSKNGKKAAEICNEYGVDSSIREKEFHSTLADCVEKKNFRLHRLQELERAEKEEKNAKEKLGSKVLAVWKLLEKTGIKNGEGELSENVRYVLKNSEKLCEKLAELERELEKYKVLYEDRSKEVADIDEKALRAYLTPELTEKLKHVNITLLRRDLEFERSKLETTENKKNRLDRELVGMRASAENPLRPEALLRKTEEKLEAETFLYDALTLAADSISEASESMKKSVTPRLRANAGDLMSDLTGGKYTELGVTPEFGITVNTDGATRPIEALSAGTRDAAYLSLRLALINVLYKNEMPPLLLDEVLSQIDDGRAKNVLSMLRKYCENGKQSLLFSCHTRESAMSKANIIKL
ncbi:MAG: AAA family ATPase [Clostridia bacterium]|nr:AAA family ATPase [Clostridia bacterium]